MSYPNTQALIESLINIIKILGAKPETAAPAVGSRTLDRMVFRKN